MKLQLQAKEMLQSQLRNWELARSNYRGLQDVQSKSFLIGSFDLLVHFNPNRLVSSAAKVDTQSIQARACFLCAQNRPKEQISVSFKEKYAILVNPYPIFPEHLTIALDLHTPQKIKNSFVDFLELSSELTDFVLFYNGSQCGASAPDHLHFQAGYLGLLPIELDMYFWSDLKIISSSTTFSLSVWLNYGRGLICIKGTEKQEVCEAFESVYQKIARKQPGLEEPMLNILSFYVDNEWTVFIFPRKLHRPSQFSAVGDLQILLSPASVDMGGLLITPREEDFNKINEKDLLSILSQVCFSDQEILDLF